MNRILISASFPESCLARQSIGGTGQWGDVQFLFEPDGQPVDAWVVIDNLRNPVRQRCMPSNTMLVTGEPASVRRYRKIFTGQFEYVWTSHTSLSHAQKILAPEFQHWHFGLFASSQFPQGVSFEDLIALQPPRKSRLISCICSDKTVTPDHRQRLRFVEFLQQEMGDQIDIYGRGRRQIADKSEAILPYRYHIVLENDHEDNFVSEKLPDAFLGWSLPIYAGSKSADQFYSKDSFIPIDMYQPQQALSIIKNAIENDEFTQRQMCIQRARERVLWKTNFLAIQANFWRENLATQPARDIQLLPKKNRFGLFVSQVQRELTKRMRKSHRQRNTNLDCLELVTF